MAKKLLAKLTLMDKSASAAGGNKQVKIKNTTNPSSKDNSLNKRTIRRAKWLNLYKIRLIIFSYPKTNYIF